MLGISMYHVKRSTDRLAFSKPQGLLYVCNKMCTMDRAPDETKSFVAIPVSSQSDITFPQALQLRNGIH